MLPHSLIGTQFDCLPCRRQASIIKQSVLVFNSVAIFSQLTLHKLCMGAPSTILEYFHIADLSIVGHIFMYIPAISLVYRQGHLSSTIKTLNCSINNLAVNRTSLACMEFHLNSNEKQLILSTKLEL